MNTRTKNLLAALAVMLLAILLGMTCKAQTPTVKPGCGCNEEVAQFSCFPDCDYLHIESMLSSTGTQITRITPRPGYNMDVIFYWGSDSLVCMGTDKAVFNHDVCQVFYNEAARNGYVKNYDRIRVMNSSYSPRPNLYDYLPTLLKK